ncbi:hypothetical protein [Caldivirga sp.]|uniref:hypothetical protein n=1 Tax=Caldivirga sp. TaxID=2080243 RepID=UPI003D0DAE01
MQPVRPFKHGSVSIIAINELSKVYRRKVKVRGLRERVDEALYVIAFMPAMRMFKVSKVLSALSPMMPYLTLAPLELHRYQYDGPDKEGCSAYLEVMRPPRSSFASF